MRFWKQSFRSVVRSLGIGCFVFSFIGFLSVTAVSADKKTASDYGQATGAPGFYYLKTCINDLGLPKTSLGCAPITEEDYKKLLLESVADKVSSLGAAATSASGESKPGSTTELQDPLKGAGIYGILGRVISTVLGLIGAVALLGFIVAGVLYMTAGESKRVDDAKKIMVSTSIGLAVIIFAYVISKAFFDIVLK